MTQIRAPIDPQALTAARAPFGQSRTLPAEAYCSEEIFDWELEHFFARSWVCGGRCEQLSQRGDQCAVRVGGDSVLVVRGEGSELSAFFNVCRHRGHELLMVGSCKQAFSIRCPYHGWTYGLDGSLKGSPRFGGQGGFTTEELGLVPCRIDTWHGWIFLNLSGDAPPLASYIGNLDEHVRWHAPERLTCVAKRQYEATANWKIIVENYHECYHCPNIHPQLCRVSPPESGRNFDSRGAWAGGSMDLMPGVQTMSFSGKSEGVLLAGLQPEQLRHVYYYGLFPHLLLSLHPDYVLTHRLEPLAPDRTGIECEWLFPREALEKAGFDPTYAVDFWDTTNQQDWRACEAVQRGVSSRGYRPGPLASKEDAVHHFIVMVTQGYLGEPFTEAIPLRE